MRFFWLIDWWWKKDLEKREINFASDFYYYLFHSHSHSHVVVKQRIIEKLLEFYW